VTHAAVADAAMANINGQRDAQQLIFTIREGCAPADLLLEAIGTATEVDHPEYARGFARTLQKALERAT